MICGYGLFTTEIVIHWVMNRFKITIFLKSWFADSANHFESCLLCARGEANQRPLALGWGHLMTRVIYKCDSCFSPSLHPRKLLSANSWIQSWLWFVHTLPQTSLIESFGQWLTIKEFTLQFTICLINASLAWLHKSADKQRKVASVA